MIHNPKVANEDSSRPAFTLYSAWLHSKLDSPEAVMSLFRDLESSVVASDEQMRPEFGQFWTQSRSFTSQLGLQPGENGLVVNGRVSQPIGFKPRALLNLSILGYRAPSRRCFSTPGF